ncbi:heavy metal translocating P-type ATPase [Brucellaceae bacterium C25G]
MAGDSSGNSQQIRYLIEGMDCASCASKIDTAVRRVAGVEDVSVSVTTGSMKVDYQGEQDAEIIRKVESLGYKVVRDAEQANVITEKRFLIEGMDCGSCAGKVETAMRRIKGVRDVSVSVTSGSMNITTETNLDAEIIKKVESLGYKIVSGDVPHTDVTHHADCHNHEHGHDHSHSHTHDYKVAPVVLSAKKIPQKWWQTSKAKLMFISGGGLVAAYIVGLLYPSVALYAFLAAMLLGLVPIARRAIMGALNGTVFSIEMLMTIAAVGAIFIGAAEEAAAVVFLFLVGELLEGVAAGKARASIQSLSDLVPKTAHLEQGSGIIEVSAEQLQIGQIIVVRPGDRIPADGEIIAGESAVDEAPVTGESTPVNKKQGENIFAGTINGDGVLRVRVTAAAADNTIARVVKLVEEAQEAKAPTERFINRFSTYYTPGVVVVAALVAIIPPLLFGGVWGEWVYKGLAILLIGCPCALVISTPAAIAASLSSGAKRGLLMKGGSVLETIGKITAAAFDKTGTLTEGKPKVTDVVAGDLQEDEVLKLAAALDAGSSHPLALAIVAAAEARNLTWPEIVQGKAIGGKGVSGQAQGLELFLGSAKAARAQATMSEEFAASLATLNDDGKTVSVLVVNGKIAGAIAMRDEPRADAIAGLKRLNDAGIRTIMLTGDNRRTAEAVGRDIGIEVRAELLPEDKQKIIADLQKEGLIIAKVGDGINDAPALATADVGIAMGGGTDVALETADAAVLHGRVSDVAEMVELSKRTMRNIFQNITIALGLKAVFLVTTVMGITGLWPAILADTGATVLVTINALRLLRAR